MFHVLASGGEWNSYTCDRYEKFSHICIRNCYSSVKCALVEKLDIPCAFVSSGLGNPEDSDILALALTEGTIVIVTSNAAFGNLPHKNCMCIVTASVRTGSVAWWFLMGRKGSPDEQGRRGGG